jgi:hypothetical protein
MKIARGGTNNPTINSETLTDETKREGGDGEMRVQNVMLKGGGGGTEGEVSKEGKETVKEIKEGDEIEDRTEWAGGHKEMSSILADQ